ncbi:NADH:flavin oxidoreductase [Natronomonas marina]|uniref:oxidoreductase n=1 Tax=Natronomonas marina TaxID=2961939 RepID=UPI0020C98E7E|nr:NADH:flavin oxidoreductase [Natronomonas marina]
MVTLSDSVSVGGLELSNRLYRAPLLECAGNGPAAVDRLIAELEPAAASGAGLVCQGATVVRGEGGCAAPGMTRVDDPTFVARLSDLVDRVHAHGSRIVMQLEHGGLRSMETWHAGYRDEHPDLEQLAVSRPPWQLRALDRLGLLSLSTRVLSTAEVRELAADFGRAAARAVDAGYDGIHIAGANMGIVQQFLSPFYNRRDDEFGGSLDSRVRFPELVHDEIRARAGDVPLLTKVPAETAAPRVVRRHLDADDAVRICERLADVGFDALVPVHTSTFWDASIVRGAFPERAWNDERFRSGYAEAFGSRRRARAVAFLNRLQARRFPAASGWNADLCRRVRAAVDVPVLLEGGLRERDRIDALLGEACDLAGMARPFYAEPRLPARLLADGEAAAVCESCNNCTVPQVTGAEGVCRTPAVLRRRGELQRQGAYDREV